MPPSQRQSPNKTDSTKVLLGRGLAIVLKKTVPADKADPKNSSRKKNRKKITAKNDPEDDKPCKDCEEVIEYEFGPQVFADWTRENEDCFWNPSLVSSVKSLEYKGFVRPTTLLVGGTDFALEVVRSAWGRRMLRAPHGYDIVMLGK
ncbi:hypothetical protein JTE90_005734 [Oedothorax gibbosus]|uniref:Storkhead-box protein 1 n=1 Tax=Oedothorax gibbosus TaxID=931172 RepID=A0AAV6TY86_9ARAC|nr:hypothetical protein JTE90_005734 [Oedothorax gibbosus]